MWQVRLSSSGVVEEAAAQAVGGHVPSAPYQYLLPDSNSWTRSCAGTWDRSAMIRLDLATDRLVNISYQRRQLARDDSPGIPDDTVHTSLPVLGGAATRLEAKSTARFL